MPTLRPLFLTLLVFAALAGRAAAAEQYPAVVTGEADFTEGDLEKSRREARDDALRKAVRAALEAEVGRVAVEDNPVVVRTRFLNSAGEFMKRFEALGETKAGFRLKIQYGYELDADKLAARIAAVKLVPAEPRPRVVLLWADEERDPDAAGAPAYRAAAWTEGATEPAAVPNLREVLSANGFDVRELSADDRSWARGALGGQEPSKAFLAEAAKRAGARATVFLRIVHRTLETPPAARLHVTRDHYVAFVYDAAKGALAGEPVAEPVVRTAAKADAGAAPLSPEWTNRLLNQLVAEEAPGAKLVVRGLASAGKFDALWQKLRKLEALGDVAPYRIAAAETVFVFSGPREGAAEALAGAFPGAEVASEADALVLTLPAAAKK